MDDNAKDPNFWNPLGGYLEVMLRKLTLEDILPALLIILIILNIYSYTYTALFYTILYSPPSSPKALPTLLCL